MFFNAQARCGCVTYNKHTLCAIDVLSYVLLKVIVIDVFVLALLFTVRGGSKRGQGGRGPPCEMSGPQRPQVKL